MSEDKPKIIIDEDWKSQVEAEREAAKAGEPGASAPGGSNQPTDATPPAAEAAGSPDGAQDDDPPMPPASLPMLVSSLATEALMALGQIPHPMTGETIARPNLAKYLIDMVAMLKEKTADAAEPEEAQAIEDILHQLRMAFVAVQKK
ncbi:hypothetical protein Mal64_20870 [Pseudobythopirellula maris]|uniref:DUF1844 domain-containing protein n=1 Tax=Pseudobythopirellula maris TaxID=2527991 RepID=A0A5C5ZMC1_9BACT|nr:DUF1844 domain-containing protein [Pseudobythopirellula maris]TWT88602.1 hypothetical protein Mal64_20870 [Pseudobythopirellula maris]